MIVPRMGKSFLYRFFGAGTIPDDVRKELEPEGLLLWDEGLSMSIHYKRFKSPRMRATGRKGIAGYVALTRVRLVAKGAWVEYSSVPLSRVTRSNLSYGLRGPGCFTFAYEASDFYEDRSGRIEHRLHTPLAGELVKRLDQLLGKA